MIAGGYAEARGHDKRAVKQAKKLEDADQALLDQAEKDREKAEKVAAAALAEKRARRDARHEAERAAAKHGRKVR